MNIYSAILPESEPFYTFLHLHTFHKEHVFAFIILEPDIFLRGIYHFEYDMITATPKRTHPNKLKGNMPKCILGRRTIDFI